ncbi:MAG: phospholipase D family protein [Sulfitobacter sp.]|uniref:phospholipase D family protein n=1 Tax=Sulfitobacter sp. TaxID=1903071 RepID=UPI003299442C
MAKYLTGTKLRKRIRKVMAGKNPRICVAFLGPNWVDELFKGSLPTDAKIVCDLRMGATVRAALKRGNAPGNEKLRHLADFEMHAKVYLSDEGAVVGSANATQPALAGTNRIEDGIWVKMGSVTHKKICSQFDERYEASVQVDQAALDTAPESIGGPGLPSGLTLVEVLRRSPDAVQGVYFVCSAENVDRSVREEANKRFNEDQKKADPEAAAIPNNRREHFSDWNTVPSDWPALFFSVYRGPRGGIRLSKNDSSVFFEGVQGEEGADPHDVFVSRRLNWRASGRAFGGLPILTSQKECEAELRDLFLEALNSQCYCSKPDVAWPFSVILTTVPLDRCGPL